MFSTLRTRFGIPGVISVIALVFAMLGGAYAASNGSGPLASSSAGHHKKSKSKAKRGPRGPKGATGATGPAGPQGPAGAKGDNGAAGANGSDGSNGSSGTSATTTSFSGNAHGCQEGGVEVKSASPTVYVCNGKQGTDGLTGFTETLPEGKTETGAWRAEFPFEELPLGEGKNEEVLEVGKQAAEIHYPISFPIPTAHKGSAFFFPKAQVEGEQFGLEGGTTPCTVEAGNPSCIDTGCRWTLGDAEATPESNVNGTLCVFNGIVDGGASFHGAETTFQTPSNPSENVHDPTGAYMQLLRVASAAAKRVSAAGTWAVRGN